MEPQCEVFARAGAAEQERQRAGQQMFRAAHERGQAQVHFFEVLGEFKLLQAIFRARRGQDRLGGTQPLQLPDHLLHLSDGMGITYQMEDPVHGRVGIMLQHRPGHLIAFKAEAGLRVDHEAPPALGEAM